MAARAFVLLFAMWFLAGHAAVAQSIVLESFDGSIRLDGQLTEFDGESYTVLTVIGPVTVKASDMNCSGDACPELPAEQLEFRISGSHNLATALLPSLVEAYSFELDADLILGRDDESAVTRISLASYAGEGIADISVSKRGSSQGLRDLVEGEASLALTTRPIRRDELAVFENRGFERIDRQPYETVLALDGLLIVTSPQNPVRALSQARIAEVFSGRISNWADIGGPDAPIRLYGRPPTSGTGSVFETLVMQPQRMRMAPAVTFLDSDAEVSDAVARDPLAIGITSFSNVRSARSLAIQGVCGIQTPATAFSIKAEEYPLARRLFIYRKPGTFPEVASNFMDFVGSEAAQEIISRTGFVDQAVASQSINSMGLRFVASLLPSEVDVDLPQLQGMMQDLIAADRLSLTFRFEQGSSILDSRAIADVQRLAEMISNNRFQNKEVLLIGYTDSVGRPDINAELSRTRAEQARTALLQALDPDARERVQIQALGYGEMSPLGCNETANGRRINRRVEVWTRDVIR